MVYTEGTQKEKPDVSRRKIWKAKLILLNGLVREKEVGGGEL
jgi:hypothetical protein